MPDRLKTLFKSYIFDGLLLTCLGIILLLWPDSALKTLCIIIGISIGLLGLFRCISYFAETKIERNTKDLVTSIVMLFICIAFIVFSEHFIVAFQYLIGVILLYGAILFFIRAYSVRENPGFIMKLSLIFAAILTVFAIIIFINPKAFASFMTKIYGISLIVEGIAMLIALRKFKIYVEKETKE